MINVEVECVHFVSLYAYPQCLRRWVGVTSVENRLASLQCRGSLGSVVRSCTAVSYVRRMMEFAARKEKSK